MKTYDGNIEPKWLRTDEYVSKSFQDSGERNGGCMDENLHGHMPQRKTFENKSRNCARVHLNQTMGGVRVNVINDVRRTRPVRQSSQNMPEYFPQVGSRREPINLVVPPMIVRMHCQIIKPTARLGEYPPAIMQNPGVVQSIPIYIKTHSDSSYRC